LEIFNVSNPAKPEFVSRVPFPPLYRLGMDMWEVKVTDRYALVADTYNGSFVVDVMEPRRAHVVAHYGLPFISQRNDPSPAAGLTYGDGFVFVAGAWSDVHAFALDTQPTSQENSKRIPLTVDSPPDPTPDPRFRVYHAEGQVHAVDFDADVAFAACGSAGLHALQLAPQLRVLATYPTSGFALGVAACRGRIFVAEGEGGLSIWKHSGKGRLEALGRYRVANHSIRQVVVGGNKYVLLHVGPATLHIVDVSDPNKPIRELQDSRLGLFYYHPLARGLLGGRYACSHWHVTGLYWYDLAKDPPQWTGQQYAFRIGSRNGVAFLNDQVLVTCRGGYALISPEERRAPDALNVRRVAGTALHGKPTIAGDRLYVSDRYSGTVTVIDIHNPDHPQLIDRVQLKEHPGLVAVCDGMPVIPGGYQGLLVWDGCVKDRL